MAPLDLKKSVMNQLYWRNIDSFYLFILIALTNYKNKCYLKINEWYTNYNNLKLYVLNKIHI